MFPRYGFLRLARRAAACVFRSATLVRKGYERLRSRYPGIVALSGALAGAALGALAGFFGSLSCAVIGAMLAIAGEQRSRSVAIGRWLSSGGPRPAREAYPGLSALAAASFLISEEIGSSDVLAQEYLLRLVALRLEKAKSVSGDALSSWINAVFAVLRRRAPSGVDRAKPFLECVGVDAGLRDILAEFAWTALRLSPNSGVSMPGRVGAVEAALAQAGVERSRSAFFRARCLASPSGEPGGESFEPDIDPWAELGITPGASSVAVKRAFRLLVRRYHPDARPSFEGDLERFLRLKAAYDLVMSKFPRARRKSGNADRPS